MRSFSLFCWNIHSCVGRDGKCDPDRVSHALASVDFDVYCLQEVGWQLHRGTRHFDQFKHLADEIRGHQYQSLTKTRGAQFGNFIISRYPLEATQTVKLGRRWGVPRCLQIADMVLRWIEDKDFSEEDERKHLNEAIRIHTQVTGARPLGWYLGRGTVNTRRLVMEEGGFLYDSDSYADDLPYWVAGPKGPHLVVPYTLDANDMRFAVAQGFNSGDQFFAYLRDTFDVLYREGAETPKMMSVGLHCRLVGRPGRLAALARLLAHVENH